MRQLRKQRTSVQSSEISLPCGGQQHHVCSRGIAICSVVPTATAWGRKQGGQRLGGILAGWVPIRAPCNVTSAATETQEQEMASSLPLLAIKAQRAITGSSRQTCLFWAQ